MRTLPSLGEASYAAKRKGPRGPFSGRQRALGGAGGRHEERLAHDVLGGDQLFRFAPLLVEYHGGELLQRLARFVPRSPVGVHARELFAEADIAGGWLEVHRGKSEA